MTDDLQIKELPTNGEKREFLITSSSLRLRGMVTSSLTNANTAEELGVVSASAYPTHSQAMFVVVEGGADPTAILDGLRSHILDHQPVPEPRSEDGGKRRGRKK